MNTLIVILVKAYVTNTCPVSQKVSDKLEIVQYCIYYYMYIIVFLL